MMSSMIQDLLDFSQIKSGKFRKNISRFNIRDSIKKVMDIQRSKANEQVIDFFCSFTNIAEKECEANLGMKSPFVKTDQDRFDQVLLGLQSNAIKFTESGKVEIRVSIEEKNQKEYLSVEVIDTGVGISDEDQNKLFKLFGFVETTQAINTHGIGLGLVISEKIVDQFGGKIKVYSEVGRGSTFSFQFELDEDQLDQNVQEQTDNRLNSYQLIFEWKPEESKEDEIQYVGDLHRNMYCEADNLSLVQDENEANLVISQHFIGNQPVKKEIKED